MISTWFLNFNKKQWWLITCIYLESEEFVNNQNSYIKFRRNSPDHERYAEVGQNLGLRYQTAYDQMMLDA